jgi:hypothetical protein
MPTVWKPGLALHGGRFVNHLLVFRAANSAGGINLSIDSLQHF